VVDTYTKTVLTVIAIALSVIAVRSGITSASAIGDSCGDIFSPCYVKSGPTPLEVTVK
jgi:hypothetical protein